jgi:integrase
VRNGAKLPHVGAAPKQETRHRGRIETLPSGSLRVSVYAGTDPITKRRHYLREVVPSGPKAAKEAQKVLRKLANQVDEHKNPRTSATVDQLLDHYFEVLDRDASTMTTYVGYADKHIRTLIGTVKLGSLDGDVFDRFYAELRRCRTHCDRKPSIDHRTPRSHECDHRCGPHTCKPLAPSTVRQIHFILSGALKRAVRWRWLASNPIDFAEPPSAPKPNPSPPSPDEAARILTEAWKDPEWGLLVWLVMVTGLRRGELCSIRWRDLDLERGSLTLARSIGQRGGQRWEKDTKSHQHRRLALDTESVELLQLHKARCEAHAQAVDVPLPRDAFVFSRAPDGSSHLVPDSVSQRYAKLASRLGIKTTIHKLRHYSATELISAGVDIRTVAGRLGHGGGGTTTLRVYTAWVSEADQRASTTLFSRMPERRSASGTRKRPSGAPRYPFERVAHSLAASIDADAALVGQLLPSLVVLAERHSTSVSTAQRAVKALSEWGYVEVVQGRGARVLP